MPSESLVRLSFVVGMALGGLSLSLLLAAVVLRVRYALSERETNRALARWFPYFLNAAVGQPASPPTVQGDEVAVLTIWLDFIESVGGSIRDRLRQALEATALPDAAFRLLKSRVLAERMLAIAVMGHLRDRRAWDSLRKTLDRGGPTSLVAARALVQIDPAAALPLFVTKMRRRIDWPLPTVAGILLEADPDLAVSVLAEEIGRAEATQEVMCQAGLLDLASAVGAASTECLVAARLSPDRPPLVLKSALRAVERAGATADPSAVRALLSHPDATVRADAARALGRVGTLGDDDRLAALLEDPEAWVRYCAAQAISYLPWITLDDLRRIRDEAVSPLARAVLEQVASEEVSAAATLEAATTSECRLPMKSLREFIAHPNWKIRLQAVDRLALAGSREGQQTLYRLLQDERWWSQYEAARRLIQRPFVDVRALRRLLEAQGDARSESVLALAAEERPA